MKSPRLLAVLVIAGLAIVGLTACQNAEPVATATPAQVAEPVAEAVAEKGASLSGQISVAGSTTVQPLAELLAEAFKASHPDVQVDVQGGGSSVGVKSAGEGTVDVGMASREVKQSELDTYEGLRPIVIALDGIAVVAHADVPVDDLTLDQVRDIFAGSITKWNEVGGPDELITVVSREEGSGTRDAFQELVMGQDALISDTAILLPSNGAVRTTVSTTPFALGYVSFGYLDDTVKALKVNGVEPTEANAASGDYPVVRPLNMIILGEPQGLAGEWLSFILSAEGQVIVSEEGYIAVQ